MSAILQALATGAGILLPVVILVILASITAVNRADSGAHAGVVAHEGDHGAPAAVAPKPGFLPDRQPTVLEILILGVVLFTLVMGGLLAFSMMGQMG